MKELTEKVKERRAFDESEANCNTCAHLRRVTAPKCKFGFLTGVCSANAEPWNLSPQIFKGSEPQEMRFHPNDPMHMPCYVPRWTTIEALVEKWEKMPERRKALEDARQWAETALIKSR